MKHKNKPILWKIIPWIFPVICLVIWFILSNLGQISTKILPVPQDVFIAFKELIVSGDIFTHVSISFQRAAIGFLIGGSIGLVLGIINGIFPFINRLFDTTIQMFRNIPHLALIPLVVIWFGIGEESKVFLVAIGVLFPVYINTVHGIRSIDQNLIEMGKIYGLSAKQQFFQIILPGALPSILVGIRYALGVMWLTLIVAETIATDSGIGFLAMNAREFMQTDIILLTIILYAIFGKLADSIAKWLEKKLLQWNPVYKSI